MLLREYSAVIASMIDTCLCFDLNSMRGKWIQEPPMNAERNTAIL